LYDLITCDLPYTIEMSKLILYDPITCDLPYTSEMSELLMQHKSRVGEECIVLHYTGFESFNNIKDKTSINISLSNENH
jgi:hypothetical protein